MFNSLPNNNILWCRGIIVFVQIKPASNWFWNLTVKQIMKTPHTHIRDIDPPNNSVESMANHSVDCVVCNFSNHLLIKWKTFSSLKNLIICGLMFIIFFIFSDSLQREKTFDGPTVSQVIRSQKHSCLNTFLLEVTSYLISQQILSLYFMLFTFI